jgi:hypothetical protein
MISLDLGAVGFLPTLPVRINTSLSCCPAFIGSVHVAYYTPAATIMAECMEVWSKKSGERA